MSSARITRRRERQRSRIMLTGCSRAEVEETIQPLVADAIEESDSEAEAVKDEDESPLIPEIDTDIKITKKYWIDKKYLIKLFKEIVMVKDI